MRILPIILLTYKRTEYALRTINAFLNHIQFEGELRWIVADDGSHSDHVNAVVQEINEPGAVIWRSKRCSYGANANWAWHRASQISSISFWLEDDWELKRPFDLTNYYDLLIEKTEVGMIRLGHMPIDLTLHTTGFAGNMYARVDKGCNYAFSGNPHLKHDRFASLGHYPEGKNPGETEIAYDYQVRQKAQPEIWWPLLIGDNPPFGHIGQVQSYT